MGKDNIPPQLSMIAGMLNGMAQNSLTKLPEEHLIKTITYCRDEMNRWLGDDIVNSEANT